MRSPQRRYLVTGASSGIGLSIVRRLSRLGHSVIGTGARSQSLLPADFPDIAYLQVDLVENLEPLVLIADKIDRLICGAGIGFYRGIESENAKGLAEVIAVNFGSVVALLHRLHPVLSHNGGRVALLGSVAARGSADMPIYSASKGALAGLARSLAAEWQDRIAVSHYRLWPVRTSMHERAGFDPKSIEFILMDPDAVADFIISTLERNGPTDRGVNPATLLAHRLLGASK